MENNIVLLEREDGAPAVSSRQIAESFEKAHNHVLRDIDTLRKDVSNFGQMFFEVTEPDAYGREQRTYLMNRDGFSLLAMGFTGKRALDWKLKYIEAFNEMEERLKNKTPQLSRSQLMATALIAAHEELEKVKVKQMQLLAENNSLKPDAEYARAVCIGDNCRTATTIAKQYGMSAEKFNELLHKMRIQYKTSDGQWVLYAKYQGKGYTKNRKSKPITHKSGKVTTPNTTVWTEKGQRFLFEQLKEVGKLPNEESE